MVIALSHFDVVLLLQFLTDEVWTVVLVLAVDYVEMLVPNNHYYVMVIVPDDVIAVVGVDAAVDRRC